MAGERTVEVAMRRRWTRRWALGAALAVVGALAPSAAGALSTYQYVRADGFVASSPSLAATPDGQLYIAVRGSDDGVYLVRSIFNGAEWTPWESAGAPRGGAKGDPSIASPGGGELWLFVRGADDKLWIRRRFPSGEYTAWVRNDQGALKGSPKAMVRSPGNLDVFVLGTDDRVYQLNGQIPIFIGPWLPLDEPAGAAGLVGDPVAASHDGNEVALFARGTDNKLWGRRWNGSVWSPWAQVVPDGVLASSPAATNSGRGGEVVFVRGTDNQLYSNERQGAGWGGWMRESLAGNNPFQDSPTAATRPSGHIDAAVRGVNNLAYTEVYRF
jgi:hypothetical protein